MNERYAAVAVMIQVEAGADDAVRLLEVVQHLPDLALQFRGGCSSASSPVRRITSAAGPSAMFIATASVEVVADLDREVAARAASTSSKPAISSWSADRVGVRPSRTARARRSARPCSSGSVEVPLDHLLGPVHPLVVELAPPDDQRRGGRRAPARRGRCAARAPGWRRTSCPCGRRRSRRAPRSSTTWTSPAMNSTFVDSGLARLLACRLARTARTRRRPRPLPPGPTRRGEVLGRVAEPAADVEHPVALSRRMQLHRLDAEPCETVGHQVAELDEAVEENAAPGLGGLLVPGRDRLGAACRLHGQILGPMMAHGVTSRSQ